MANRRWEGDGDGDGGCGVTGDTGDPGDIGCCEGQRTGGATVYAAKWVRVETMAGHYQYVMTFAIHQHHTGRMSNPHLIH